MSQLNYYLAFESTVLDSVLCGAVVYPIQGDVPNVVNFAKLWQANHQVLLDITKHEIRLLAHLSSPFNLGRFLSSHLLEMLISLLATYSHTE